MVVDGDVMDVRLGRPDSQNLKSSMHLPIPTPHHKVPDQKPTRNPRPRSRLQSARSWKLVSMIAGSDFEKREPILQDIIWTLPRIRSRWWNRVDELRQVNLLFLFQSSEGSSSELQQVQLKVTIQLESDST